MHACSLNYDDRVCSNFYDIWGDFMEATQNEQVFPTLTALKRLGASPDDREVTFMQQRPFAAVIDSCQTSQLPTCRSSWCIMKRMLAC